MDSEVVHARLPAGVVARLLQQLRPIDGCLGLRLYRGSALAALPEPEELALPSARSFWLAAWIHYAQAQGHSGLSLQPTVRLSDLFFDVSIPAAAEHADAASAEVHALLLPILAFIASIATPHVWHWYNRTEPMSMRRTLAPYQLTSE